MLTRLKHPAAAKLFAAAAKLPAAAAKLPAIAAKLPATAAKLPAALALLAVAAALLFAPPPAHAQGRIAVVNLQEAIIQTDEAQQRLNELREGEDYKADKAELDKLRAEREEMINDLKKELEVMSPEQQQAARKRLANKNADLEHVLRKLQQAEQELVQRLLQEMAPKVQTVLNELIQSEGIGLLIQQNVVIHADNGYRITAKVTDKLNQQAAAE